VNARSRRARGGRATPRRGRRSQAERSSETQQRLLEATAKILRQRGYAGLRTEEASAVAGVSRGAQLHHFPTKDSLVLATTEHIFRASAERGLARAQRARDSSDPLEAIIQDGMDFFFSEDFLALLDLVLAGGKNRNFRDLIYGFARKYRLPVEAAWLEVLVAAGMSRERASTVLWLTLSIVRGLAVRALWQPDRKLVRSLLDEWKRIISEDARRRKR